MSRRTKAAIVLAVTAVTGLCAIFILASEEHALPRPEAEEGTSSSAPAVVGPPATAAAPMVRVEAESQHSGRHPGLAGGWIRGRVVDGVRGEPIEGADLRLVSSNTGAKPASSTTVRSADDGRFTVVVGVRGAERLEVRAPGREMRSVRVDGDGWMPQLDLGDVPLHPAKASRLWVVDPSGSPVVGASVFCRLLTRVALWGNAALEAAEGSGNIFELANPAATTGEDGTAVLPQLTFGTHRLLVVRDGFRCHLHDVQVKGDGMEDVGTVTLDPAEAVELTLAREDGGDAGGAARPAPEVAAALNDGGADAANAATGAGATGRGLRAGVEERRLYSGICRDGAVGAGPPRTGGQPGSAVSRWPAGFAGAGHR